MLGDYLYMYIYMCVSWVSSDITELFYINMKLFIDMIHTVSKTFNDTEHKIWNISSETQYRNPQLYIPVPVTYNCYIKHKTFFFSSPAESYSTSFHFQLPFSHIHTPLSLSVKRGARHKKTVMSSKYHMYINKIFDIWTSI